MRNIIDESLQRFMRNRKRHQRVLSILLFLSVIVSGNVFWALRRPGVTMAGDAMCGFEEHSHTEACYEETLICQVKDKDLHTHEDACYEVQTIPASEEQALVCELLEPPHTHTDACYSVVWTDAYDETVLICENAEEGHVHGDGCYEVRHVEGSEEKTLTCELTAEPHTHVPDCYETVLVPEAEKAVQVCVITELQHEHNEACYETRMLCEASEHVHSLECYADETADVETQLDWQAMFANHYFTYNLGIDLAEIAKTQIGYRESELNFVADADGTRHGYTRYGAWYGAPYSDWSAMFVSFCLNYAGGSNATTPFNTGADSMAINWQALGLYASSGEYTPQAGDLVFFYDNTVGIVYGVYGDSITVIKGDVDDAVVSATISVADASIKGWGLTSKVGEPEPTPTPQESGQSGTVLTDEMLDSLNQYDAWAVIEEPVAAVYNMRTMSLRANSGIALAVEMGPAIDMRNMITKVTLAEKINGVWTEIPSGGTVTHGDELRFTLSYQVPAGTLTNTNTIYYNLPTTITTVTATSGNIYDNNNAVVGTFAVDNEAKQIRITFNDEYASKNAGDTTTDGQIINGSLAFRTTVDSIFQGGEDNRGIIFNDNVSVDLQVKDAETVNGDVHVEKTISSVSGNIITYQMKVSSTEGTYSAVQLTDTMTGGIVYVNGSLNVDGTAKTPTITENGFTLELDPMAAGGTYTVTYQAMLPENAVMSANLVKNKAEVNSTDDKGNEIKDSSEVDHTFEILNKWGRNDGQGNISWTIEVNKSKLNIGGWTLSDTVNVNGKEEDLKDMGVTVTIKNSAGETVHTGPLPYKFPNGSKDTYTVTYTTSHVTGMDVTVLNKAKLEKENEPDRTPIEDQSRVGIGVGTPLSKSGDVLEETLATRDGTQWVKVRWDVTINTKDGPIGSGVPAIDGDGTDRTYSWYFMDKLDDNQYMTYGQLIAAVDAFKTAVREQAGVDISNGSYRAQEYDTTSAGGETYFSDRDPKLDNNQDLLYERFRIYVPAQIPKGKTISFSFEAWAPYENQSATVTYKNRVNFNNYDAYEVTGEAHFVHSQPTVEKMAQWPTWNPPDPNLNWNEWGGQSSDSSINLDYESLYYDLLCWRIQVNIPSTYKGDLRVIEHLPEGLTISSLQARSSSESPLWMQRWKNDGTTAPGFQWWVDEGKLSIPIDISGNDITFTVSAENVAYILANIPEANKAEGGHKLYFYIFAQINDDAEWIDGSEDALIKTASFENNVTLKNSDGDTFGTDTQTQVITKNLYIESVYKTSTTPGDNIVPYEVVLNKDGLDLDPTSDTLTIEDLMEYVSPNAAPIRVRLVPGSVALETYSSNAGYEPTAVDFKYTYEELSVADSANNAVNWTNKILLTIPDETPVTLSYRYAVTGKEGQNITLDNTCSITGVYEESIEDSEALEMTLQDPEALANITTVSIYKVEEGDYSTKLAGAKFHLYRYNSTTGEYEQVVVERVSGHEGEEIVLTSNESGALVLHLDHDHADYAETYHLAYDTAYKLVEFEAPEGYYLSGRVYEFYIISGDEDGVLKIPANYTGHVLEAGDNIYFENERDTTEITVEKVWRDLDNNIEADAVADAHDSVTLQLYQKTADGRVKAYGDPIVLNGSNDWKATIKNLPKAAYDEDTKGETYYYYVEEIDKPSGYTVSYTNNSGINSGSITVTNTKASAYELPKTGGPGALPYILLGMTLITIPVVYGYRQRRKHEGRGVR